MEDRMAGKRNSLTSADRDSGNGDSLDVSTGQPRLFTPPGNGSYPLKMVAPAISSCNNGNVTDQYIALELRPAGSEGPLCGVPEAPGDATMTQHCLLPCTDPSCLLGTSQSGDGSCPRPGESNTSTFV